MKNVQRLIALNLAVLLFLGLTPVGTAAENEPVLPTLDVGQSVTVDGGESLYIFEFAPTETGLYEFETMNCGYESLIDPQISIENYSEPVFLPKEMKGAPALWLQRFLSKAAGIK